MKDKIEIFLNAHGGGCIVAEDNGRFSAHIPSQGYILGVVASSGSVKMYDNQLQPCMILVNQAIPSHLLHRRSGELVAICRKMINGEIAGSSWSSYFINVANMTIRELE